MSSSNIVAGEPDFTPKPSNDSGELSGALGAAGGLLQAALSGNLAGALKGMAVEQGKKLATAALMKIFTIKPTSKPAKPPWSGLGKVAPPGSAVAAAAMAAYNSVHTAPTVPVAGAPGGAGGSPGGGGAGAGSGSGGSGQTPPWKIPPEKMWTNIDLNDLAHAALAAVMMPAALLLRSAAAIFPETMKSFFDWLPQSSAGTQDKNGWIGFLFGNSNRDNNTDKTGYMPGCLGIANSLGHALLEFLGFGYEEYEDGQHRHDIVTGVNPETGKPYESDGPYSAKQAAGQLLGALFYNIGLGNAFYEAAKDVLGPPNEGEKPWYGFMAGVWQGTHQKSI